MANNRKNDEIILASLLSTPTIRAAAAACDVSESVIYSRLKDPEFKERYDGARREMLIQSAAALQSHLNAAIEALGEIVNDKDVNPQTRLNAAEAIIRNTLKLTERTDVLNRLDELAITVEW